MNDSIKGLSIYLFIVTGLLFSACNSASNTENQDMQDTIFIDTVDQPLDTEAETPVERLIEQDSLDENNRGMKTP